MHVKVQCNHPIVLVRMRDLKPHPKNRNIHSDDQISRLAKILEYQGVRYPIKVSNRSGFITSGHGRLLAAQSLGWKEFPVSYQDYESEEQEYADVQADNAIASWAELDLSAINSDLGEVGPDFDIDLLGIKDFVLEPADIIPQCDEDEVPDAVETRCKSGDLWSLGRHRLLCGDSTFIDSVERLMDGQMAGMVFTDPPYGIDIDADYGSRMPGFKGLLARDKKHYSDIIGDDQDFDPTFILERFADSQIFLWGANHYTAKLPKGHWFVWYKKTSEGMRKMFGWDFELCWTNQKAGQVYEQTWAGYFGHNKELDGEKKTHPSMKSVAMILQVFQDYLAETVLDLYGGSGSTMIACEKTNRTCYMMEIDPHYCSVILARWEKYTGKKAELTHGAT